MFIGASVDQAEQKDELYGHSKTLLNHEKTVHVVELPRSSEGPVPQHVGALLFRPRPGRGDISSGSPCPLLGGEHALDEVHFDQIFYSVRLHA